MSTPDRELTPKQTAAALALLTEGTKEKAAARVGVSVATLRRWEKDPAFLDAVRAARRRVVEDTVSGLQAACAEAVAALARNLTCGKPAAEIRAAEVILDRAAKGVELVDLIAEVEELKKLLPQKKGRAA
jgi:hypothetical protein